MYAFSITIEDVYEPYLLQIGFLSRTSRGRIVTEKAYQLTVDFGKFGKKISVGRFTEHDIADIKGKKVLGVLNFEPRKIGNTVSEVLILGVQFPRAESGEATFITPLAQDAKIGGKLF